MSPCSCSSKTSFPTISLPSQCLFSRAAPQGSSQNRTQTHFLCRVRDLVPARCLQMRTGRLVLPHAEPGAVPASPQVPGTSREMLKQKGSLQNHLQADKQRAGAGSVSQPWRGLLLGAVLALTRGQQASGGVASLYTGSEEGEQHRCNISAQKNKGGVDTCALSLRRVRWKPAPASSLTLISPWLELPVQPLSSLCFLLHARFSSLAPK